MGWQLRFESLWEAGFSDYTFQVSMSYAGAVFRDLQPMKRVHDVSRIPSPFLHSGYQFVLCRLLVFIGIHGIEGESDITLRNCKTTHNQTKHTYVRFLSQ